MFDKIGGLGNLGEVAKQFGGNNEQKPEGDQAASSDQKWSNLGGAVKQTVGEAQESRAKGENVDFAKLGGVAKQAAEAYNSQENKNDLQGIGKSIASGFMGGGAQKAAVKPEGEEQAPNPTPAPEQASDPTPQQE